MATPTPRPPFAAIDMGSNSFRLEMAQFTGGRYRRVLYDKETVRLGAGLNDALELSEEAMARGWACLSRFGAVLQAHPGVQVRAVATATLRDAQNRDRFLSTAQAFLGHPIEVISGREEARLIYAGVARLQPATAPRLVVDIGGRSTEMILGHGLQVDKAESFQVGSVSVSLAHFPDGRITAERLRAAQIAAGAELEEALRPFSRDHWQEALGSSGTVGAVSDILVASGRSDGRITAEHLRDLLQACLDAGHVDRLNLPGLKEDRRAVVGGGLCILYTLLMNFGIDTLWPAQGALRQGVIFDLHERWLAAQGLGEHRTDQRGLAIVGLQKRFEVDTDQAGRVGRTAMALWQQLHRSARLQADETRSQELAWACALHECGMMISHHVYHRHSAYVVEHGDLAGFSQSQQLALSQLVLAQRGGLRKVEARLQDDPLFAWQVLCLRLAVILCHARENPDVWPELRARKQRVHMQADAAWRAAHPRTAWLMGAETEAWAKVKPLELVLGD